MRVCILQLAFAALQALAVPSLCAAYTPEQVRAAVRQAGGPEQFIAVVARNTAKMAGRMLDDQTEIIGAAALDRSMVYYLRLVNHAKSDVPNITQLRRDVARRNAPSVCTAPTASILINEFGAEYKYIVYSKTREHLFEYTFNRTTCAADHKW